VQLFYRMARGVELTDAGRAFLDRARSILASMDSAFDATRSMARGEQGRISVGVMPTGPFHPFVPRIIRKFREKFPMVTLMLDESLSTDLIERVGNGQMDVAFIRTTRFDAEHIAITSLLNEPMIVALPHDHEFAQKKGDQSVTMKQLAGEAFILYGMPGSGTYDSTIAACSAAGFTPRISQQALRVPSCLGLVAVGLGIALVPESIQRTHMDGVAYRRIKGPVVPTARLSLASRRGERSAVVRNFLGLVRSAAKSMRS